MNHITRLADTLKELIDNPQVLDQVMDELSDAEIVLLTKRFQRNSTTSFSTQIIMLALARRA